MPARSGLHCNPCGLIQPRQATGVAEPLLRSGGGRSRGAGAAWVGGDAGVPQCGQGGGGGGGHRCRLWLRRGANPVHAGGPGQPGVRAPILRRVERQGAARECAFQQRRRHGGVPAAVHRRRLRGALSLLPGPKLRGESRGCGVSARGRRETTSSISVEGSRASATHKPREDWLVHPADTSNPILLLPWLCFRGTSAEHLTPQRGGRCRHLSRPAASVEARLSDPHPCDLAIRRRVAVCRAQR
jgi:hypothetical protein